MGEALLRASTRIELRLTRPLGQTGGRIYRYPRLFLSAAP
jgi:hypothetical protein